MGFLRTQEIPALCPELSSDGLFYRSINNHGLLGGTHRSVVEALADQDVPRNLLYIRRTLDEHGDAAGGPTSKAGLPEEHAAYTSLMSP